MRKTIISVLLFSGFSILVSGVGYSQEMVINREVPYIVRSTEAMGMGGAFYGKSDNKFAAFYNPAGLTRVKGWSVDIIPITLGVNTNFIDNINNILPLISGSGGNGSNEVVDVLVNSLMGKFSNITPFTFFPAYTSNKFTVGIFSSSDINLIAYDPVIPTVSLRVKTDNGVSFATAGSFLNDSLSVGFSLKGLVRGNIYLNYNVFELISIANGDKDLITDITDNLFENLGFGFLTSVGAMYNLPFLEVINPRVALSLNDFGFTFFSENIENIAPTVNASIAISPRYYSIIDTDILVDFTDIFMTAGYDNSFLKRLRIGGEIKFIDTIALRVGVYQGYPTFGAGLYFKYFKINYAFYTEELGSYIGQMKDNRHILEFAFRI